MDECYYATINIPSPPCSIASFGCETILLSPLFLPSIWTSIYLIEYLLLSQPNSERWPVLARQVEAIICSAVACMLLLT